MKKFRWLAFKSMADKLEDPSDHEQDQRVRPQAMKPYAGYEERDRQQDRWDAPRVAGAVDGMLMAGRIPRYPLLAAAPAQHARDHTRLCDFQHNLAVVFALLQEFVPFCGILQRQDFADYRC